MHHLIDVFKRYLSNPDNRKLYNKSLNILKNYQNLRAKNWFLEKCSEENLIPNDFKIKKHELDSMKKMNTKYKGQNKKT